MSYRTTVAAVRKIIEIDDTIIVVDADLEPFIEIANALVTRLCASALDSAGAAYYTSTDLELIERWLSAHFYCVRDPRTKSEGVKGVSESFEGSTALYFASTRYGQQAMMLDTHGGLAAQNRLPEIASKARVGMIYLGTTPIVDDESL